MVKYIVFMKFKATLGDAEIDDLELIAALRPCCWS